MVVLTMTTSDSPIVVVQDHPPVATIALNDAARRNAMGLAMFDGLQRAVDALSRREDVHVVLLRGEGRSFCAGFDLAAAVEQADLMAEFIHRLSRLNRSIRRLPQAVVAAVRGHALAGGCAVLSACDFVIAAPDATLGYPVHRIGVSPAVTLPLLRLAMGDGAARGLALGGELISGVEAKRVGLATHVAASAETVEDEAQALCDRLAKKGPQALRATKAWLNELDGSGDDRAFDLTAEASARLTSSEDAQRMLRAAWAARARS
jgi:methylglutaconyl-CoA hydratase